MPSKMIATVSSVAVRLGGEFALLSESEERHRALLTQAEELLASSQSALATERSHSGALQVALERVGALAEAADAAAHQSYQSSLALEHHALTTQTSAQALATEVASIEEANASFQVRASEDTSALELMRGLLEAEQDRSSALGAALADSNTALEASRTREVQLRKDLDEERQRSKRFASGRAEKEKQLAVALCEKNRVSQLLSKKDTLARDLSTALKSSERQQVQKAAQVQAQQQQRRIARAQAVLAIGEAAAEKALPLEPEDDAPAPPLAARGGVLPVESPEKAADVAARMRPRAPGAPRRFEGWRDATPAQREAALRSENAVLIGVLAERDAALDKTDAEMRRLRAEHAAMRTRWRGAVGRAADDRTLDDDAQGSANAASSRGSTPTSKKESANGGVVGRKPRPQSVPPGKLRAGGGPHQPLTPPGAPATPSPPSTLSASPLAVPGARVHVGPTHESPA